MKPKQPIAWLGSLFAYVAALNSPLSAQSTTSPAKEPVVELSPFVVNSTKDTGYQATSTLAGTRLDTPLKDVSAAISIYTKDFMEDIGATDLGSLLIYATNMEAAGVNGNFSGSTFNQVTYPYSLGQGNREGTQTSRSRGLSGPTITRDFFGALVDFDSYNTDRVTVLRGPNAALFGVASPAGITDTSLARANLRRNENKVTTRFDNNGGLRFSADFNRVLMPDKLAVRLIGLNSREEYNQRPSWQLKERIFGALNYRPFESTSVRANFESGRQRANQPDLIPPTDAISNEWYLAGRPGFDWTFYDDPARNPFAAVQNAGTLRPYYLTTIPSGGTNFNIFYSNPTDRVPSLIHVGTVATTTGTAANALKTNILHPLLNRDLAADTSQFVNTANFFEFPVAAYWTGGNVPPGQLAGFQPPGLHATGFRNFNAFDFKNRQLDESARYYQSFRTYNFIIEQRAWENRLGFELAYDAQRVDRNTRATFFSGNGNYAIVRIDTTVTMPDGMPNPNLGRPFTYLVQNRWTQRSTQTETRRATAFIKYDFRDLNDSWGQWLGRHTLNGVGERSGADTVQTNQVFKVDGPGVRANTANINGASPNIIAYLGPSLIGNNNPLKLDPIKIPMIEYGPLGNMSWFQRPADATTPGGFGNSPVELTNILVSGRAGRDVLKSQAATLQSYWLQDHLVSMFSWRKDSSHALSQSITWTLNPANPWDRGRQYALGWDDMNGFPSTPPLVATKETTSFGLVAKWPHKLIRLPNGIDFSIFYNNSENFSPRGHSTDFWGVPLPVAQGKTREFGFNFSAFNDRLSVRTNWYKTDNKDVGFSAPAQGLYGIPIDLYLQWAREGNTNPHLVAMRQADMALLTSVLPSNLFSLYNVTVSGTAPSITTSRLNALPNGVSTTDYVAKGIEVDITYNPTPNWRIMANIAKQEAVQSNILPSSKAIAALMAPIYKQLANRAATTYPTGWQVGDPLPTNIETVAQYVDRIQTVPLATTLATEGIPNAEPRKWRFNLVTNYSFGRGSLFGERLKGWSIGGGLRWQDKMIMGYPTGRLPDSTPTFDMAHPWYAPSETNIDAFVGYTRKIWNNRIDWKMQLNATNIFKERDLIPVIAQPWGEVSNVRLAPESRWYLTNTFSF